MRRNVVRGRGEAWGGDFYPQKGADPFQDKVSVASVGED